MNDKLQNLINKIGENPELEEKLQKLTDTETLVDDCIALCKEYGIEIAKEDLEIGEEMSDDELGAVTGGGEPVIVYGGSQCVDCICVAGGGGSGVIFDGIEYPPCACVLGGGGVETNRRKYSFKTDPNASFSYSVSYGAPCACVGYGSGKR